MPRTLLVAFACVASALLNALGAHAFEEPEKYLIVASPSTGKLWYSKVQRGTQPRNQSMQVLLETGLKYPQGVAIDHYRKLLYVADPGLGKLVSYLITHGSSNTLNLGPQNVVAEGVEVRAVAVDGLGDVFFSEEPTQKIMRVTAATKNKTAEVVYDSTMPGAVGAPSGIALDNYFVYWLNKASGSGVPTLVRGHQEPQIKEGTSHHREAAVASLRHLASNRAKCYGLCLALGNIFYTDEHKRLYGIPRASVADEPVVVSENLQEPRGCAYDGDGAVYVADKTGNAVYTFPSNMEQLQTQQVLTKAADVQGAFGVAVYVKT